MFSSKTLISFWLKKNDMDILDDMGVTLPVCIFNGILYTHENTLLLERSKYTLMSTYIFERT